MELKYFASYSFKLFFPFYKGGKESVYAAFIDLISELENKKTVLATKYSQRDIQGDAILIRYSRMPFANLLCNEELRIEDNTIGYSYEEKNSDRLMLPNIFSYVYMVLLLIKITERLSQGFDKHSVACTVEIFHNGETYFYDKYSPLKVIFSWLHKYKISEKTKFDFLLECNDDIYVLINKLYQQYKTDQSKDKAFVTVDKSDFLMKYGEL